MPILANPRQPPTQRAGGGEGKGQRGRNDPDKRRELELVQGLFTLSLEMCALWRCEKPNSRTANKNVLEARYKLSLFFKQLANAHKRPNGSRQKSKLFKKKKNF